MILTVTAPSGVGKSTFIRALLYEGGIGARMLTSTTTRAPRGTDLPLEYEYISEEEYQTLLDAGEFLKEYGRYGNRYGTRISYFNDAAFFKSEPCVAAALPQAVPLWRELVEKGLGSYRGKIMHLYLDLADKDEHTRRLLERGEKDTQRFEDDLVRWKEEAVASGIPYHFLDASKSPYDMVDEVKQLLKNM